MDYFYPLNYLLSFIFGPSKKEIRQNANWRFISRCFQTPPYMKITPFESRVIYGQLVVVFDGGTHRAYFQGEELSLSSFHQRELKRRFSQDLNMLMNKKRDEHQVKVSRKREFTLIKNEDYLGA